MSDEIKKAEMTSEETFSEEIKRRLAEPDSGKPSLEEFKLMVYKDRERRRKRRNAAVAGIVVVLLAGFFAFDTLVPEVGADKNPKEEIITEDGVIIEDGGWGSSEEEDNVWVTEDWEQVSDIKKLYPNILTPKYIPAGYIFDNLRVEILETENVICEYFYKSGEYEKIEIELVLINGGAITVDIDDVVKTIMCGKGKVYFQEAEKKKATIQFEDGISVCVWADIEDREIIKVIESLDN